MSLGLPARRNRPRKLLIAAALIGLTYGGYRAARWRIACLRSAAIYAATTGRFLQQADAADARRARAEDNARRGVPFSADPTSSWEAQAEADRRDARIFRRNATWSASLHAKYGRAASRPWLSFFKQDDPPPPGDLSP